MIYLDYSATTPVDERVLDTFVKVTRDYIGNPNSLHELGVEAKKLIDASTKQIADILKVKENEIIFEVDVLVTSTEQLNKLVKDLQNLKYINNVVRHMKWE